MEKQHFSVTRVVTHTKENISKFERHDERKNTTYSNTNIVAKRTPMNIYFKRDDYTFNQKFDEMVKSGQISTRGLKTNAKIYNELVFDVNSLYFEENGGYEFAKSFYEKTYNFAEKEMGTENILTAVLHADELNTALTEEFRKEIYHYYLHVIAIQVVQKEIKNKKKKDTDITQFISNVKKYTEIDELTPEILNELIEKIVVHQTTKINGKKVQEIDIYYRGVGIIYFPINLDDIEITIEKILNKKTA